MNEINFNEMAVQKNENKELLSNYNKLVGICERFASFDVYKTKRITKKCGKLAEKYDHQLDRCSKLIEKLDQEKEEQQKLVKLKVHYQNGLARLNNKCKKLEDEVKWLKQRGSRCK